VKTRIPHPRFVKSRPGSKAGGFSLLEMVVSLALVTIVLGIVLQVVAQMQQRNFTESAKVDTVQETRDFVDQMVRDIHDVGYPPGAVKNNNPPCDADATVACGVITFTSTQVIYEGDLDGTGTVYRIWLQLLPPASGKCPCILQRGAVKKQDALGGTQPTYFTEVNGVLNSGNGGGAATYPISLPGHGNYTAYGTADVFTAYDQLANPFGFCYSKLACAQIYSLQITANVVPNFMDQTTEEYPVYSVTSKARMNNNWLYN
jgi:type II secretory pathway pseudopilin PulG